MIGKFTISKLLTTSRSPAARHPQLLRRRSGQEAGRHPHHVREEAFFGGEEEACGASDHHLRFGLGLRDAEQETQEAHTHR